MKASDEQQYIAQAMQGDQQAFNLLVDHYYQDCFQKAVAIVRNETLAQDLTQVSLLQAYRCLDKLKDPSRFKYWLLGIVKNLCFNYLKQKKKRFFPLDDLHALIENKPEEESRHIYEVVLAAVQSLEKNYRDLILAFYYDGLSLQEIVSQQKLSLSAAKVRLHRARQILKQKLAVHEDLFYYYQKSIKEKQMKQLVIADIYEKENGSAAVLLQTETGDYFLPVIIGYPEAEAIVFGMQRFQRSRPWTHDLAAAIISETELKLVEICIHKLEDGVFHAHLTIQKGKKKVEVDARPSDAIAMAVRLQAPIFVSENVLEEAGLPIPASYQNTKPKGKGLNQFVRYFAKNKAHNIAQKTWKERKEKVVEEHTPPKVSERVLNLVFGDGDLPKVNLAMQPHRYTTWDEALKEPDQVSWLDLKNQNLDNFAEKIKPFQHIHTLELEEYGFSALPAGIEQVKNLQRLNVSNNQLANLPSSFSELTQLVALNLSNNAFQELPESLGQLPMLHELHLSQNPSLSFSQAFQVLGNFKMLYHLRLNENNFTSLPEDIAQLSQLQVLELTNNPSLNLSQAIEVLQKIPTLFRLDLQHLQLTTLPDEILSFQQLVWLNLSDNPTLDIKSICQQLHELKNLKVLILMRCELSSLPEELHLLSDLEVLELGENHISEDEQIRIKKTLPNTTVVF